MSSKNPFEIRADVLALAQKYIEDSYRINVEYTQKLVEQGQKTSKDLMEAMQPYTFEDVMEKAQKMYNFVQTKDKK